MKVEREEGGRRTAGGLNSGLKYQSASEEEQRGRAVVRGESTRAGQERDGYERKTERERKTAPVVTQNRCVTRTLVCRGTSSRVFN